nr:zinc finger, CCHC-type [Tanacetum cinerariifolium]GFB09449.1 zinc finger, CCHC-type [Tanacetum cinerariifolium]
MPNELGVSLILNSLNKDYEFIQNYIMHRMGKTLSELHAMLKLYEKGISKKAETPLRNCPSYHAELKKRKNASMASTSGLRGSRKLKHRALSLYMGNRMRAAVEAIRSFDLFLTVTRVIVLISRLVNKIYIHTFTNYGISVSKDNVFYFNAIPRDGIYEIDMHNLYPNSCISGKMARKPFPHQVERAKDLLGLIYTNGKDKGKTNLAYAPNSMILWPPKRENLAKDSICHHCEEVDHYRRNNPAYHIKLKKKKVTNVASTSGS